MDTAATAVEHAKPIASHVATSAVEVAGAAAEVATSAVEQAKPMAAEAAQKASEVAGVAAEAAQDGWSRVKEDPTVGPALEKGIEVAQQGWAGVTGWAQSLSLWSPRNARGPQAADADEGL